MSNAIGMFLRQIVLQHGIPFEMKLPANAPVAFGSLTKKQFDTEINKGMNNIKAGRVYSSDTVEEDMEILSDLFQSRDKPVVEHRPIALDINYFNSISLSRICFVKSFCCAAVRLVEVLITTVPCTS